jgi:hypothetical protein
MKKISRQLPILLRLDLEQLKQDAWFPYSNNEGQATIIACRPKPELAEKIKNILNVTSVDFKVALPDDLTHIIEHNLDVNPGFPAVSGRTPLARVRTYLDSLRTLFAYYRTMLSKSRTGLAFMRTGISCITISLLFLRIFGGDWLSSNSYRFTARG